MAVAISASLGSFAKGSKTLMSVTSLCFRKSVYGLEGRYSRRMWCKTYASARQLWHRACNLWGAVG